MNPKIMVAIPCYQGNAHIKCMESVMNLSKLLHDQNMEMDFFTITFESLIPRARNVCACHFLNSNCTHLLFIDADIVFNPYDVLKMIMHKKHIVSGSYPKKALKFELIKEAAESSENMQEFLAKSVNYASNFKKDGEIKGTLVEVLDAPTGFMLISRPVFHRLIDKYPEIKYKNDIQAYKSYEYKEYLYDFFQSSVIDNRYLSEDYGFCRLWQGINDSKIFIDFSIKLIHIGAFMFIGNPLLRYFKE
jgi:hypothetical protein